MIRLVTDSTCDLPEGQLAALNVSVVPINIHFATQEYQEGETLGYDEFFQKIEDLNIIPTTSQPSPGEFANTYRVLAQQGATTILSLHVTSKLSGTVQSANLAASLVQGEVDVRVFDSLAGSAGTGFMILEAANMLEQGATADAVLQRWSAMRDQVCILFTLDTLKYAQMSGRVSALQSAIASMLKIKPLIRLDEGNLIMADRVRTRRAALARMLDMLEETLAHQPINLAVIHAQDPVAASDLMEKIQARFDCRQTFVAPLATSLVTNLGIGTLGVVAYPAE